MSDIITENQIHLPMRNGDVYFWSWKSFDGRFIPYHCKATKCDATHKFETHATPIAILRAREGKEK